MHNPTDFPLDSFYRNLTQRKWIDLKHVQDLVKEDTELKQDWFTVAVLVSKSDVKVSSNGSNFMILTLGNLEGVELSFFIFGDAFSELCKLVCGCVVAVLNALPLPAKDGRQSYKIDTPSKMLRLGSAFYYSRCAGIDGIQRCEGYVNLYEL